MSFRLPSKDRLKAIHQELRRDWTPDHAPADVVESYSKVLTGLEELIQKIKLMEKK